MKKKPLQFYEFSREYIAIKKLEYIDSIIPHWHNSIEIDLMLSGSGTTHINNTSYKFRRGTLTMIITPDSHSYDMDEPSVCCHLSFDNETVQNETLIFLINNSKSLHLELDESEIEYYLSLYKMIEKEHTGFGQLSHAHELAVFEALLYFIFRKARSVSPSHRETSDPIKFAANYINEHFKEDIKLKDISKLVFLSEKHLSRKFKEELDISFSEYVINRRLTYASGLLAGNTFSISNIAIMSGFNSPSYFIKQFRKKYGVSPSEYRKTH